MARALQVLAAILFALLLLRTGEGLKCYHCVAPLGGECDDPTTTENFVKECPTDFNATCYTRNTTLRGGASQIVRDCAPHNVCAEPRGVDFNTTCTACNKDLCNSSPSHTTQPFLVVSIVIHLLAKFYV